MCDITAERAKIDRLLLDSLRENPGGSPRELSERSMRTLLEHYGDACPDQCVARRVEAFVDAVVAGGVLPGEQERPKERACG